MKKKSVPEAAFFNVRSLILIALFTGSIAVALFAATVEERTHHSMTNATGSGFDSTAARSASTRTSSRAPVGSDQWKWQRPLPQGNPLNAVSFTDANSRTAVGDGGTILRTTDGGSHWSIQANNTRFRLMAVSFTDGLSGVAVGTDFDDVLPGAVVLKTTDGGNNWVTKYTNPSAWMLGVSFSDANTGTAIGADFNVGTALILRTTDGGDSWVPQTGPPAIYY